MSASLTGALIPLVEKIDELEVGQTMKLKGKTLETDPSLQISNEETTTTREADESTQTPQGMIPMQVFSLRVDTGSAVYDSILLLDEEGHLFSMEIKDRMGSFKVSRIE